MFHVTGSWTTLCEVRLSMSRVRKGCPIRAKAVSFEREMEIELRLEQ